jgi:microcystin-dependent protein
MAITNIGYDGTINEPGWAKLQAYLGRKYGVGSSTDFAPSGVAGVDRTTRIAPGSSGGHGVLVISDANVDVQSPTLASGTRWDTVVLRRDWQTNTSSIVVVAGTSTEQIAAGLNANPGVIDDMPLALVQITSGTQAPTAVKDLRPNVIDADKHDVGDIFYTAAATAPFGSLVADGSAVSRAQYSRLFARIGTAHGAGNGTTTFNLPNVKGKVLVGQDTADTDFDVIGETRGAKTVALITAELPAHAHGLNGHTHGGSTSTASLNHSHTIGHNHGRAYGATYGGAGNHAHGLPQSDFGGLGGGGTLVRLGYNGSFPSASAGAGAHDHSCYTDIPDVGGSSGASDLSHAHTIPADNGNTANTGSGTAHNNIQPSIVELPCIQV